MAARHNVGERTRVLIWPGDKVLERAKSTRILNFVCLVLLPVLLAVDFHFDVHQRDAFSWMDPDQYYGFAKRVLNGESSLNAFEVPTIFPFFVLPFLAIDGSIAASLWTNMVFLILLVVGIHLLCRSTGLKTPSAIVALVVLASPLLVGLARTLYIEFALTALVAIGFAFWFRSLETARTRHLIALAIVFGLGVMTKMTYPLFFIAPVCVVIIGYLAGGRYGEIGRLALVFLVPAAVVMTTQYVVFNPSFDYYTNLGNTSIPVMRLIGPPHWFSWSSAVYYFHQLYQCMLVCLLPLLLFPLVGLLQTWKQFRWESLSRQSAILWLWLLGPLTLLIIQSVKEPRHVAPCVTPAVLLVFLGIERIRSPGRRIAVATVTVVIAVVQFVAVTNGAWQTPYFLDRPVHLAEIERTMLEARPARAQPAFVSPYIAFRKWAGNQNMVINGFEPNAALAIAWHFRPAIVYDLQFVSGEASASAEIPYERFEDLYLLTAFNLYNRRAGWQRYYSTLSRDQIVSNADFVLLKSVEPEAALKAFPRRKLVASLRAEDGPIQVLKSASASPLSYRSLYAREFMKQKSFLSLEERNAVGLELLFTAVLREDFKEVESILNSFPDLKSPVVPCRNIYWLSIYRALHETANLLLHAHFSGKRR